MTNTLTIPLELAERLDSPHSSVRNAALESLRRIIAAPVVERQGPVVYVSADAIEDADQVGMHATRDPNDVQTVPLYTSPPAPVAAIKPVVWRIPVNGDWFYGTKEQCARERAEYESTFTAEDFEDAGTVEPEPLACLDKVKEMNQ